MAELGKTLISIENVIKLFTLLMGFSGVVWTLKTDNQSLRNEVMMAVQAYKAADEKIEFRIDALSKNDERQDKDIDALTNNMFALIPEGQPKLRNRNEGK
jgi:hypothetical protein